MARSGQSRWSRMESSSGAHERQTPQGTESRRCAAVESARPPDGRGCQSGGETGTPRGGIRITRLPQLLVWRAAWKQLTLTEICDWLREEPSLSGPEIGRRLATDPGELWTDALTVRIGNGLGRWAGWMAQGNEHGPPAVIPRRWRGMDGDARSTVPRPIEASNLGKGVGSGVDASEPSDGQIRRDGSRTASS